MVVSGEFMMMELSGVCMIKRKREVFSLCIIKSSVCLTRETNWDWTLVDARGGRQLSWVRTDLTQAAEKIKPLLQSPICSCSNQVPWVCLQPVRENAQGLCGRMNGCSQLLSVQKLWLRSPYLWVSFQVERSRARFTPWAVYLNCDLFQNLSSFVA